MQVQELYNCVPYKMLQVDELPHGNLATLLELVIGLKKKQFPSSFILTVAKGACDIPILTESLDLL